MTEGKEYKRKKLFLNPRFQLKYSILFFGLGVFAAAICGGLAFLMLKETLQGFLNAHLMQSSELISGLEGRLRWTAVTLAGVLGTFCVGVFALGIWMTHRVVGPLSRLEKAMREAAAGNLGTRVRFRSGDEFQELAEGFNGMMERVQGVGNGPPREGMQE